MLSRSAKRISPLYHQQYRCFASGSAYDAFSDRVNKLKSSYPNLFNESSFKSDQEGLLSSYRSSLSSSLNEYDSARTAIDSATGDAVFMKLDQDELEDSLNTRNRPFYKSLLGDMDDLKTKIDLGQEYVSKILDLQREQESASTIEQKNLLMIQIADYGDKIDEWLLRFPDLLSDSSDLGLPISDEEVDQWVKDQYHYAPDEVRVQGGLSYDQHKQVEEEWMRTLDDKLVEVLKSRNASFDENKFREFCQITNEMFHPHAIDHYGMNNYAKSLFRAALWQSQNRTGDVEKSVEIVAGLLNDGKDDDSTVIRGMYENNPGTRFSNFAAYQLKLTDPLFSAKLIQEIRNILEQRAIDRAQKDVLYDLQVPYLQTERKELETELEVSLSSNPASMKRDIYLLKEQEESYNIDVPELSDVLDEILPTKLWNNDISSVKSAIMSYASGSGSLSSIDDAINSTLGANASADTNGLDDVEILDISVKYHNSRYSDVANFNFRDFLAQAATKSDFESVLLNRRVVVDKLSELGVDPLVINLVRILVEDGTTVELEKICEDYLDIMKRYRGEIDGLVTSAEELDDSTFNQIKDAIESANPGKKITLERLVDPGLQSGFIVKAGVQRFDFSLATVIHQGRMAVGTV